MADTIDHTKIAVVFACHDGEGNYLFSKRSIACRDEHGTWDPGAGAVDFGDTVLQTLRKEIEQEYCTDVIEYEFLGFRDVHRESGGVKTCWLALDFKVRVDRTKATNGEPHKFEEVRWFALSALPEPMHSQWPIFVEKYREQLFATPSS